MGRVGQDLSLDVVGRVDLEPGGLTSTSIDKLHASTEIEQLQFFLDVVVRERAVICKLLASSDERLLLGKDWQGS